jgi:hypothetical protein
MIVIAALLILIAALLAARLLASLAIHAMPLWCGGALAWSAYAAQAGWMVSVLAGLGGAFASLVIVQLLARSRSALLRAICIVLFAVPAAIAGYFAAHGLAVAMIDEGSTARMLAIALALLVGGAAAMRCLAWGGGQIEDRTTRSASA